MPEAHDRAAALIGISDSRLRDRLSVAISGDDEVLEISIAICPVLMLQTLVNVLVATAEPLSLPASAERGCWW
jgi:hypothetical protein